MTQVVLKRPDVAGFSNDAILALSGVEPFAW